MKRKTIHRLASAALVALTTAALGALTWFEALLQIDTGMFTVYSLLAILIGSGAYYVIASEGCKSKDRESW